MNVDWKEAAEASAEAQTKIVKVVQTLPCKLDDHELASKGGELAELQRQILEVEAEKKSVMAQFKKKLDGLGGVAERLGLVIINKSEDRDVDVEEAHVYATGRVVRTRLDTGEVFEERPMTESERAPDGPLFSNRAGLECTVKFGASWKDAPTVNGEGEAQSFEEFENEDELEAGDEGDEDEPDFDGNPPADDDA